jgi:hypothetical protein
MTITVEPPIIEVDFSASAWEDCFWSVTKKEEPGAEADSDVSCSCEFITVVIRQSSFLGL